MSALLVLCAAAAWVFIARVRRTARGELAAAQQREEALRESLARELAADRERQEQLDAVYAQQTAKRDHDLRAAQSKELDQRRRVHALKTQSASRLQRIKELEVQLERLDDWDGRLWHSPVAADAPAFLPAAQRPTRFISILNLKGGVGKTTLTANLGVSLARRGHRVLLVDLDFQFSLTGLCLSDDDRRLIQQTGATAGKLLDAVVDPSDIAALIKPVRGVSPEATCHVIGADETLADAEHRAQARWLVGLIGMEGHQREIDGRFLFRTVFHIPQFLDQYDYVLFDCPPRLTTACVNALACSDFLIVPTVLDQLSVEAIPRTLGHLGQLASISPARLLAVVGNRATYRAGVLFSRHQNSYDLLLNAVRQGPYARHDVHRAIVEHSGKIEDAANDGTIAALTEAGLELFKNVTDLVDRRSHDATELQTPIAIEVA